MASVCACLYGFASALSHSLFVGERSCLSRCTEYCHPHNHYKRTIILRSALRSCLPFFEGEVSVIIIRQNFHQISNQSCTIAKPRPFHYPTKIRNIIKGRNLLRLTAARAEFATSHGYYYKQKAPSLNSDRFTILQKSATLSKVGIVSGDPPLRAGRLSCR